MKDFTHKLFFASPLFLVPILAAALFSYSGVPQDSVVLRPQREPVEQYDPSLLTWSLATSTAGWEPRDSGVSFVFQNKMWTMGGLDGNQDVIGDHNVVYWKAPHFNDIWTSEDGISWKLETAHAAWSPRRSMSVLLFKDSLWMFGGWTPTEGYETGIWKSDDGVTWTQVLASAPWPAREGQTAEVFQGKMWMIGGVNYDKRETKNDVWWSEDGFRWNKATTTIPWSSRWDHATTVFRDKIFLSGGMDLQKHVFKDVWSSSDGVNWELVTATPPWQERQGHSLVVFHDMLWTIGRLNEAAAGGANDIWYSKDGAVWEKTKEDPAWLGREDHSALVFDGRIYVFEGMNSKWRWDSEVWVSSN